MGLLFNKRRRLECFAGQITPDYVKLATSEATHFVKLIHKPGEKELDLFQTQALWLDILASVRAWHLPLILFKRNQTVDHGFQGQ